ncbi:DUF3834 domain-containing protein [Acidianus sulfidivorans JP7]|uniref:DUF3834 domain-containing protein n=1 Tax=Acidianus sulfidivorans JP7 TaxID=619593 RepID=A0A2U9IKM8_9CREN|nr:DUF3834 domain-containing protein [Acidianus sulfidivorans]AWR96598.1 DUF3834 domain-containing protein [Acidianus sulfidivorans JP7]
MKALVAPGPVSYPLIASTMKNKDIEIFFGKEGNTNNVDVILDSTVSLVKRGLKINYVTIKGLMSIYPDIGKKIGVWRKGSAADVLTRALLSLKNIPSELIYADDMEKLMAMLQQKQIDSAVVSSALGKGKTFEELLGIPGSCGATVYSNDEEFIRAYNEGIEIMNKDPEKSAEYILSKLPIKVKKEFIIGSIKNSEVKVEKIDNYKEFEEIVKRFS